MSQPDLEPRLQKKSDFEEPKAQEWHDLILISNIISKLAFICKHCVSCIRGLKMQKIFKNQAELANGHK